MTVFSFFVVAFFLVTFDTDDFWPVVAPIVIVGGGDAANRLGMRGKGRTILFLLPHDNDADDGDDTLSP